MELDILRNQVVKLQEFLPMENHKTQFYPGEA